MGELVSELSREATGLIRGELELARAEMNEKLDMAQRNLTAMAMGAALLLASVIMLAIAANWALTALLENWMSTETAVWLAPLLLTVVLAIIGYGLVKKASTTFRREGVVPHQTVDSLRDDQRFVERKVKS